MLKDRKEGQFWVEPFVGGANMIDKVTGNRIGADFNSDLINLLNGLKSGWLPKETYSKDDYLLAQSGGNPCGIETGYIAFNCSYSGKYWGRFAGKSNTAKGVRDYTNEAYKNVCKQAPNLKGVEFFNVDYKNLIIPESSIIYCDPPYKGTYSDVEGYGKLSFDHDEFWQWCRDKSKEGHTVFVSEYNAPDDFICIWQQEVKSSLSANGKSGGSKKSVEKLFTIG